MKTEKPVSLPLPAAARPWENRTEPDMKKRFAEALNLVEQEVADALPAPRMSRPPYGERDLNIIS